MRARISLWLMLPALAACARSQISPQPSGSSVSTVSTAPLAPELRAELLARLERDQAVRQAAITAGRRGSTSDSALGARMADIDTANTAWLERIVAQRGWPGPKLVGADGADAAFILVQHASHDTAFQARVLPILVRAHARGDATGQQVALLTDRLAVSRGQPQVYGTQAAITRGRVLLDPIADSAHVDARRAAMGMMPLRDYVRMLDSLYTGHVPKR